ncbi:MAG: DUF3084 domain-containing protein [Limnochordales bacterium]|nr:DUF3084 domain-containing protein [Limnochordales bacterium]
MPFGLLVIIITVLLGALVAWVGDRIGRKVGRQRLSLFGLRPKYTSVIVTITTGAFIVLVTITTMALLSQDARTALFGIEELRSTIKSLESDRQLRQKELNELQQRLARDQKQLGETLATLSSTQKQLQAVKAEIDGLNREISKLTSDRDKLLQERARLAREKEALEAERSALEERVKELGNQVSNLRSFSDRLFGDLSRYFFGFRQGHVVIRSGQPLSYGVIPTDRDTDTIKGYLNYLLTSAAQTAQVWGAGADDQGHILLLNQWVTEKDPISGELRLRQLSVDEILDQVAHALRSNPNVTSAIVRVVSVANTLQGEPVPVDFELFINRIIYNKGDIIDSIILDGRSSEAELFTRLYSFLRVNINQEARARGVLESPEGSLGEISIERAFSVIQEVRKAQQPVRVDVVAAETISTIGPLNIDFHLVIPAADTGRD